MRSSALLCIYRSLWEQGTPAHLPAEVLVKRKKRIRGGGETWEVVRARGHLDEVQELRASAPQSAWLCYLEQLPARG